MFLRILYQSELLSVHDNRVHIIHENINRSTRGWFIKGRVHIEPTSLEIETKCNTPNILFKIHSMKMTGYALKQKTSKLTIMMSDNFQGYVLSI